MDKSMMSMSCADFADALAAKCSVPGGGGAAAYAGALAAALCGMVGEFSVGKKRYADVEPDIKRMLVDAKKLRCNLLALVDADACAFEPLSRAYALPREAPNRADILEDATKTACTAPLDMVRQCARAIELLEEMGQKGSRMLLSDVGCGAFLAHAAMKAAAMNVFVNTKTLADRAWAEVTETEVDKLLDEYLPRAEAVADQVMCHIRGRA